MQTLTFQPSTWTIEDSGGSQLVSAGNLQLVGGFRVPQAIIGSNTKYLSGSIDFQNGKWILGCPVDKYIREMTEPGPMGTGDPLQWPLLEMQRFGKPFDTTDKMSAEGVLWLDSDRVLCSGRKHYRSGFEANWVAIWNLSSGTETLIPVVTYAGDGSIPENENFHNHQAFGGGFCRIPQEFADQHTGGRTIGMGRGGYDVLGSPMGPALAAWQESDTEVMSVLVDYPYQESLCPRDPYYEFSTTDPATPPVELQPVFGFSRPPENGQGWWVSGNCSQPAWVQHASFRGVLWAANQNRGALDYRAQGDSGGSIGMFGVDDPPLFYSDLSSGNRGGHQVETWNQGLTPATQHNSLYVFDPDEIAEVAQGLKQPWECSPNRYDFPETGIPFDPGNNAQWVSGLHWDNERQLLWVCIRNIWHSDNKYAILAAYQLE